MSAVLADVRVPGYTCAVNYYNEHDKFAAQWIRNLIEDGQIAPGVVDERDIRDVVPNELVGFAQCHFFAGIAGWPLALRIAGVPDDKPLWTGSAPCQPFGAAGRRKGFADERHLWPFFFHLIEQCHPNRIYGEQVASADALAWLDLVQDDLEASGYAFGAVDTCSCGFGSPHIRQRLYWMGDADSARLEGHARHEGPAQREGQNGPATTPSIFSCGGGGKTNGYWSDADWLQGSDTKWRAVQPGAQPMAARVPQRVGRLRAYGNAVNVQAAAEFIKACG